MNDDDLPINAELASAYLDGELDATERAAAAGDPEVMAIVDSFTRVRAALGEAEPVVESSRTAAIAAALAEFDSIHATVSPSPMPAATTARIISMQSRRMRTYRVLTGVAAALVVGVVAVAALNSTDTSDQASTAIERSAAPAATEAPAEAAVPKAADSDDTGLVPAAGDVFSETTASEVPAIDNSQELTEYASGLELAASTAAPADAATTDAPVGAAADAAAGSADAPPACIRPDQVVLGAIVFQGDSAFAVRDDTTGALQAIDAVNCRLLVEVPAP
jgi:negative regulator of sigma E activity